VHLFARLLVGPLHGPHRRPASPYTLRPARNARVGGLVDGYNVAKRHETSFERPKLASTRKLILERNCLPVYYIGWRRMMSLKRVGDEK
jgi:hypothetical protein